MEEDGTAVPVTAKELAAEVERLTTDKRRCHALLQNVHAFFGGDFGDEDERFDWGEILRELEGCESGKCTDACEATANGLEAEVARLKDDLAVREAALVERDKLLRAIPECPDHGPCVPHAVAWVKAQVDGGVVLPSEMWRIEDGRVVPPAAPASLRLRGCSVVPATGEVAGTGKREGDE